jgi:hypothetical protein
MFCRVIFGSVSEDPPRDSAAHVSQRQSDSSTSKVAADLPTVSSEPGHSGQGSLDDVGNTANVATRLLLSPKSFYCSTTVHVADPSPLPSVSVSDKQKKCKSHATQAADLTSTPNKKNKLNPCL